MVEFGTRTIRNHLARGVLEERGTPCAKTGFTRSRAVTMKRRHSLPRSDWTSRKPTDIPVTVSRRNLTRDKTLNPPVCQRILPRSVGTIRTHQKHLDPPPPKALPCHSSEQAERSTCPARPVSPSPPKHSDSGAPSHPRRNRRQTTHSALSRESRKFRRTTGSDRLLAKIPFLPAFRR